MVRVAQYVGPVVAILGVVAIALGVAFIVQGISKDRYLKEVMHGEKVTLGLTEEQVTRGEVVDTAKEAEQVGDTVRGHRHNIAETYVELLDGGQFDPTNPDHLTYAQALNLENYLYLAVLGFGLTTVVTVVGVFMIITGIALGGAGAALFLVARKVPLSV